MPSALELFSSNIDRIKVLHAIQGNFESKVTEVVDLSDILRSELVLIVSALDHYVHEIIRFGMIESWMGRKEQTNAFLKYPVEVGLTKRLHSDANPLLLFDEHIRARHSYQSFQHPDRIAEAIRLISTVSLWEEVGKIIGRSARDIRSELALTVDRRNKIAHEADVDPSYPDTRWPINRTTVENAIELVVDVVHAIDKLVS